MAAREPRSRNSRRGTRHATKDLAEVAMQVAQAGFDDEVAEAERHEEMPKPTIIESMKAGIKLDPAALLLRLPTPARTGTSKAVQLPSPPPPAPAPAPASAPLVAPLTQAPAQPPTAPPSQPPAEVSGAAAGFKGPEPWSASAQMQRSSGGYREFLQARGQHAMQRSQLPSMQQSTRFPTGQAVPPPPSAPAPGAGYAMPLMPSPQMQQCYPADLTPMSQMSPISPTWYGSQSFEMPSSPMMQQFSPCMQQGQSAFMMPQQGYMPMTPQSQGEGWTQQPAQGEQWAQGGLQAMLMPQACYMDAEQVAKQLQDAAEAAGAYDD